MPDLILTEEEQMLQTTLRGFVDQEIAPKAKESDERAEFQWEQWRGLAGLGLMGLGVDTKYGGSGPASYRQVSITAEEVARGDASASVSWLAHLALGVSSIDAFGSEDQKQRLLPPLTTGQGVAAFGLTEPGGGSDAAALQTTATERDGTYFLNGSKMFITNASVAQSIVVFATQDRSMGYKGVSAFVVQKDSPGLTINPMHGKLGMRSSTTDEIVFQDTPVPSENLLGVEYRGSTKPWKSSRPAASSSRPRAWESDSRLWRRRCAMPSSANHSANPSPSTKPSSSCWPTWPQRSTPPA